MHGIMAEGAFRKPVAEQPTPDPSQEGNWYAPLPGGARGGFMVQRHSKNRKRALPERGAKLHLRKR